MKLLFTSKRHRCARAEGALGCAHSQPRSLQMRGKTLHPEHQHSLSLMGALLGPERQPAPIHTASGSNRGAPVASLIRTFVMYMYIRRHTFLYIQMICSHLSSHTGLMQMYILLIPAKLQQDPVGGVHHRHRQAPPPPPHRHRH